MFMQLLCPSGRYGASLGETNASCSGVCSDGYQCAPGSSSSVAVRCDPGYACKGGQRSPCPVGTYSGAGAKECTLCTAGRYSPAVAAASADACMPCPVYPGALIVEGSFAGAAACWPGVLSANASNPPPLVPGFSVGDVVTVVFTKATNASGRPVVFSPSIGGVSVSWLDQGRTLVRRWSLYEYPTASGLVWRRGLCIHEECRSHRLTCCFVWLRVLCSCARGR
jgi:hypothetical protein